MREKKGKNSLRDLWDNIKHTNICIIEVLEEEKGKGPEKIFEEIIVENFPNMGKQSPKYRKCRIPYRINSRRNTLRHISIKPTINRYKERY